MKPKHLVLAVTVGSAALLASGLLVSAYFASLSTRDNELTIADNVVEISESFSPPESQTTGDNIFQKDVSVTNTGPSPCYVRIYADFSDSFVRSRSYFSDSTDENHLTFYSARRLLDDSDDLTTFPEYVNSGSDWVFVPEDSGTSLAGYYYYTKPLPIGGTTPSLFRYVKTVNPTEDDIDTYDILVYSESTQLTDINGTPYENYEAAWTDYLRQE